MEAQLAVLLELLELEVLLLDDELELLELCLMAT